MVYQYIILLKKKFKSISLKPKKKYKYFSKEGNLPITYFYYTYVNLTNLHKNILLNIEIYLFMICSLKRNKPTRSSSNCSMPLHNYNTLKIWTCKITFNQNLTSLRIKYLIYLVKLFLVSEVHFVRLKFFFSLGKKGH